MNDSTEKEIRVLVVDDSDFQREVVTTILESEPGIHVVGEARNGLEAIDKTVQLTPDVITMDIRMPLMDGLDATREIMATKPTPIVVVSTTVREEQRFTFTCLSRGALDFVPITPDAEISPDELINKVRTCSRIGVITHPRLKKNGKSKLLERRKTYSIVGIAVSTGGPLALQEIMASLPRDFPVPGLIVQHIPKGFSESLVEWLMTHSRVEVVAAEAGDEPKPGRFYVAPCDRHMIVDTSGRIQLMSEDIPRHYHKPSADIMLESVANCYGSKSIGVILTGMGKDGALGMRSIHRAGGYTVAQNEASSVIYGMNKVAVEAGAIEEVVPLDRIADRLVELVGAGEGEGVDVQEGARSRG
jgi:two-component system chemotaxis response regulator CheB